MQRLISLYATSAFKKGEISVLISLYVNSYLNLLLLPKYWTEPEFCTSAVRIGIVWWLVIVSIICYVIFCQRMRIKCKAKDFMVSASGVVILRGYFHWWKENTRSRRRCALHLTMFAIWRQGDIYTIFTVNLLNCVFLFSIPVRTISIFRPSWKIIDLCIAFLWTIYFQFVGKTICCDVPLVENQIYQEIYF